MSKLQRSRFFSISLKPCPAPKQISFSDIIEAIEGAAKSSVSIATRSADKPFFVPVVLLFLSAMALTGCEEIGEILKSDIWTEVLLVFLVIGATVYSIPSSKV